MIKHKLNLLNLAEELGNVLKACEVMGLPRDTFHGYKSAVEDGGVDALFDRTRRKPNVKNRVDGWMAYGNHDHSTNEEKAQRTPIPNLPVTTKPNPSPQKGA